MLAESWHPKFARLFGIEVLGFVRATQLLTVDLALQLHEGVQQCFWSRRATWNVNIDWNVTIDPFEHVVALLEWSARNRTRAHGDDILRIGHLVVESHNLRRHFLGHGAGHNHEIGLPRRRPENFAAKTCDVVARCRCRDHLDRATGEPELQWP